MWVVNDSSYTVNYILIPVASFPYTFTNLQIGTVVLGVFYLQPTSQVAIVYMTPN